MLTYIILRTLIQDVSSSASKQNAAAPAEEFPYNLAVALITLLFAPVVAAIVTAYWTRRQKRRELDTAAARELYALYGEFLAIWKLWNLRDSEVLGPREPRVAAILERTTVMEGRLESLLLDLTSRFSWAPGGLTDLGLLRQIFQLPRNRMKKDEGLHWNTSDDPEYLELKRICTTVGTRLTQEGLATRKNRRHMLERSVESFRYVTGNIHEGGLEELSLRQGGGEVRRSPES